MKVWEIISIALGVAWLGAVFFYALVSIFGGWCV